jgi:hypothetical protein
LIVFLALLLWALPHLCERLCLAHLQAEDLTGSHHRKWSLLAKSLQGWVIAATGLSFTWLLLRLSRDVLSGMARM